MLRCRNGLNGDAAALFSMARNVFGGIGISVSTALIADHQQIRQSYLIDHLSPSSAPYEDLLQHVQQALLNSARRSRRRYTMHPVKCTR